MAFRISDGVFVIAEAHYGLNQGEGATGLPGTHKAGAYFDPQNFADQRRNGSGASQADPAGVSSTGRSRRGRYGLYAIADQLVYRKAGTKDQGAGVFPRLMGAPGDHSLVDLYVDAGVTCKGLIPGRNSDIVGVGFALARRAMLEFG